MIFLCLNSEEWLWDGNFGAFGQKQGDFPVFEPRPQSDSWESVGQAKLSAFGPMARWLMGPKGKYQTKNPSMEE